MYDGADTAVDSLIEEMSNPEIQDSIARLVSKLPTVARSLDSGEEIINYLRSAILDESTLDRAVKVLHEYMDGLDSEYSKWRPELKMLSSLFTPSNVGNLTILLQELLKSTDALILTLQVARNLQDSGLLEMLLSVNSVLNIERLDRSKQWLSMAKNAREKAKDDDSVVSIFGMYKILKDPSIQEGLKTLNAMLKQVSAQTKSST